MPAWQVRSWLLFPSHLLLPWGGGVTKIMVSDVQDMKKITSPNPESLTLPKKIWDNENSALPEIQI